MEQPTSYEVAKFYDREGREWYVNIAIGHVLEIRNELGINIDEQMLTTLELLSDRAKAAAFLWIVCGSQAEARGISQREFLSDICDGFAQAQFQACFDLAIENFTLPARRPAVRLALGHQKKLIERAATAVENELEDISEVIDEESQSLISEEIRAHRENQLPKRSAS